jgi:hypothetical protein
MTGPQEGMAGHVHPAQPQVAVGADTDLFMAASQARYETPSVADFGNVQLSAFA